VYILGGGANLKRGGTWPPPCSTHALSTPKLNLPCRGNYIIYIIFIVYMTKILNDTFFIDILPILSSITIPNYAMSVPVRIGQLLSMIAVVMGVAQRTYITLRIYSIETFNRTLFTNKVATFSI